MASEFNWNDIDRPYLARPDDEAEDKEEDEAVDLEVLLRSVQED